MIARPAGTWGAGARTTDSDTSDRWICGLPAAGKSRRVLLLVSRKTGRNAARQGWGVTQQETDRRPTVEWKPLKREHDTDNPLSNRRHCSAAQEREAGKMLLVRNRTLSMGGDDEGGVEEREDRSLGARLRNALPLPGRRRKAPEKEDRVIRITSSARVRGRERGQETGMEDGPQA